MRKGSTDRESPADLIDNTAQVGKKVTGSNENEYVGGEKNEAANNLAQAGRTPPKRGPRQKWLREIAKTAASARWSRGD